MTDPVHCQVQGGVRSQKVVTILSLNLLWTLLLGFCSSAGFDHGMINFLKVKERIGYQIFSRHFFASKTKRMFIRNVSSITSTTHQRPISIPYRKKKKMMSCFLYEKNKRKIGMFFTCTRGALLNGVDWLLGCFVLEKFLQVNFRKFPNVIMRLFGSYDFSIGTFVHLKFMLTIFAHLSCILLFHCSFPYKCSLRQTIV